MVARRVCGLLTVLDHAANGSLVPNRDHALFTHYLREILYFPSHAAAIGRWAAERATRYTWAFAAARLRRLYIDLGVRRLVSCGA